MPHQRGTGHHSLPPHLPRGKSCGLSGSLGTELCHLGSQVKLLPSPSSVRTVLDCWPPVCWHLCWTRAHQGGLRSGREEQGGGKLLFCRLADVTPTSAVPNCRPTTRRKPDYEPVGNTDEAQKKFGNVKAISSDMYFGRQDHADVSVWRASAWAPRAGAWECGEQVMDAERDGLRLQEARAPGRWSQNSEPGVSDTHHTWLPGGRGGREERGCAPRVSLTHSQCFE